MKFTRLVIALWLAVFWSAQGLFPATAHAITLKEEEELGKEFMNMAARNFSFIEDPVILRYVEKIAARILAVMPPQPFEFRFFVVRQEVYNAFAAPAGNIFINSGLIEAMDSEDELAGILGHEMVHVSARHISQKIERATKIGIAAMAGMVAAILLGAAGAGAAAQAVGVGSSAAGQSASLAYSRQDEMQADELGIQYLTAAGYSGAGLLSILKKIREMQWFTSSEVPSYLMTHPAVGDRIAYLDAWMERNKDTGASPASNQTEFRRFRTRLIAGYGNAQKAATRMQEEIQAAPDDPIAQHGYAIALARTDRVDEGIALLKKALQQRPFDAVMLKDLGEMHLMAGHYEDSVRALESSTGIDPSDWEAQYLLGRARSGAGSYAEAVSALQTALEKRPNYRQTYYYLGEAYGKMGDMGEAHYYLGLHYYGKGDLKNALFHLTKAKTLPLDPERMKKVDELLKRVRNHRAAEPERPAQRP